MPDRSHMGAKTSRRAAMGRWQRQVWVIIALASDKTARVNSELHGAFGGLSRPNRCVGEWSLPNGAAQARTVVAAGWSRSLRLNLVAGEGVRR
jgi:hypothetical protein